MFTGAGILIVELYMGSPVITLFGMNGMNYSDPGGMIDMGETPDQAAHRECREETENLINIQPHELLQYAIPIMVKQYMSYILYIENLSFQDYAHNVNLIYNGCNARSWKETNSMARVPINNMILAAQSFLNYAIDINGTTVRIRERTMLIVRNAVNILSGLSSARPIPLYRHLVTSSRMPCLIGTITYTISPQAIYTPTTFTTTTEYAVYVAPNLTNMSHSFLRNCNPTYGGIHVTIAGYHISQPSPQKFIQHISNSGKHPWTISENTIKIKNKTIYFKSKTLDIVAKFLHDNGFYKVKGPNYSNNKWHITSECKIPSNIKSILKKQKWSIVLISKQNNVINWLDRYPLNIL